MVALLAMTKGARLFDGINHPDAATVAADGLIGALLYLGTPGSPKDVTAAQYAGYKAHGLWTLLCYEHTTTDISGGANAGIASANAGRLGVNSFRFGEVTPMPRSVPPCICGRDTDRSANVRLVAPVITSVTACGTPR